MRASRSGCAVQCPFHIDRATSRLRSIHDVEGSHTRQHRVAQSTSVGNGNGKDGPEAVRATGEGGAVQNPVGVLRKRTKWLSANIRVERQRIHKTEVGRNHKHRAV